MSYRIVGQPVGQVAGPAKVTGRERYTGDLRLPGMLFGALVRSPYPHATIVRVNTEAARSLPGVRAVLTGSDIPEGYVGRRIRDLPILARDRVRFVGEKVAAVVADTPEIAEEAALLVDVEYEELPAVLDVRAAMAPGAPVLHPDLERYAGFPGKTSDLPNVLAHRVWSKGDVDEGFRRADFILQRRYTMPRVHQGYLEPHCCIVHAHPDGSADIWATNKTPFMAREQLAAGLHLDPELLNVHVMPLGGDFGGKGSVMDLPIAYYLSRAVGAPVRLQMNYVAEFTSAAPRHAAIVSVKTGVTKEGRIVAHQVRAIYDSGAYGAFKPSPTLDLQGASKAAGPYRMDTMMIEAILVYTNQVPSGHMRAPGLPQVVFALESHLDSIARQLDLDPLEFRLRNVIRDGEAAPNGDRWHDVRARETLEAAARVANWGAPLPTYHGRGIALAEHGTGAGFGTMKLRFDDGGYTVVTAVPDTGTGSHTILQQVAAEELGVPVGVVRVEHGQTDDLPLDSGVGGSKTTHVHGQAVAHAAHELRERLVQLGAAALGAARSDVSWDSGAIVASGTRHDPRALIREAVVVESRYDGSNAEKVTSFCAQVAEVAVDVETGQVRVTRIVSANDAGTVINPIGHLGQIEGGVAQGLGYALIEELPLEDGRVTAQSFADYKIPAFGDLPPIETVTLEHPSGPAPYRAKGIGETPNVPLAAAIANAIEDAVGVRMVDLPITAERVHTALGRRPHHHPHHHDHGPDHHHPH